MIKAERNLEDIELNVWNIGTGKKGNYIIRKSNKILITEDVLITIESIK